MTDEQLPPEAQPANDPFLVHVARFLVFVALWVVVYVIFALIFGGGRMEADWWPLDSGHVVPNLLAGFIQIALAATFAFIFYKPASSWLVSKFHKHLHIALHHHRTLQAAERKEEHQALHDRLEAIEKHLKGEQSLG